MFVHGIARRIAVGQTIACIFVVAAALYWSAPLVYGLLLIVVLGPSVIVERQLRRRTRLIEEKLDGFIVTLTNALKATPSIGNALGYAQPLLGPPLEEEIALLLKEMRLGTSLDQALLNLSNRVRSPTLDATLASILIGRQVGGNLPRILETTAETLREMSRLQGVVRSKTAEGKVQLFVVALAPIFLVGGFHLLNPNYFTPLVRQPIGLAIIVISVLLWVVSLVLARRIVSVDL
jgi:tight adherence protein B